MLTDVKFNTQIKRLKNTFGEKNFSTERQAIIYKEMQRLTDNQFSLVVDRLIWTCKSTPLKDEFAAAVEDVLEKERREERARIGIEMAKHSIDPFADLLDLAEAPSPIKCYSCYDTGLLIATSRKTRNEKWFRCRCAAGLARHPSEGPIFKGKLLEERQESPFNREEYIEKMNKIHLKWKEAESERQKAGTKFPTFRLAYPRGSG